VRTGERTLSGTEREHLMLDAWLFLAIADPLEDPVSPLANVIASADTYYHSVPNARAMEHAVRDLSRAGLISVEGLSLKLTADGRDIWGTISQRDPLLHRRTDFAQQALSEIPCVAAASGWSLDDGVWEDALAEYSPQFALELRKRWKNA